LQRGERVVKKRGDKMKAHRQYVKEQIRKDPRLKSIVRTFRITIMERVARDTRFRQRLLTEAINQLLAGDLAAGKAMLRDYINATISFERLARVLKKSSKSLHRMLGPSGNPTAESLLGIIKALQVHERVQLEVKSNRTAA
jgi:DNA-binding phage protein